MNNAKNYEKLIQEGLGAHAAWLPIANNARLGDYGLISGGVFTRIGNIDEFGVQFRSETSPAAKIDLKSAGTTVVRGGAGAAVPVAEAAGADIKATLTFSFEREGSYVLKAANVVLEEMTSPRQVAEALDMAAQSVMSRWRSKWRVVRRLYRVTDALILSSVKAGTKIDMTASADVLHQIEAGAIAANANVAVDSKSELGMELLGATGPVALGWFRLGWFGGYKNESITQADTDPNGLIERDLVDDV